MRILALDVCNTVDYAQIVAIANLYVMQSSVVNTNRKFSRAQSFRHFKGRNHDDCKAEWLSRRNL
jgi:hypothetical protein